MWGAAKKSPRAIDDAPKHDDHFRDVDDPAEPVARETSQNSADARSDDAPCVRMRFATTQIDFAGFEQRWLVGFAAHANAWKPELMNSAFTGSTVTSLVIEDFGTKGLEGELDSPGGPFYAFWRQYGISPKQGNTGGRHGVGKSTLAAASRGRLFFGLTVRKSDARRLLMGQAILGPHELNGHKYEAYAEFSPTEGDQLPAPFEGLETFNFAQDFELSRTAEPGLSVAIPAVREDIIANDLEPIKRSLVANCFPQVASGNIEFQVGGEILKRDTLREWADRYPDLQLGGSIDVALAAFDAPKTWSVPHAVDEISSDCFNEADLENMRTAFVAGELICVRVPVALRHKINGELTGYMRLHLQRTFGKHPHAEHYARSRLTVPKQKKVLAGSDVVGLLYAEDGPLSDFLGDAEPPSHTRWVQASVKDKGNFLKPEVALPRVAGALRQLERVLQNEEAEVINPDAFKALFARPKASEKKDQKDESADTIIEVPEKQPFWEVRQRKGGFELVKPEGTGLPDSVTVRLAYARRRGSPNWKATDFELDQSPIEIISEGPGEFQAERNIIEITGAQAGFTLSGTGFDVHRDLVIVLKAKEAFLDEAAA